MLFERSLSVPLDAYDFGFLVQALLASPASVAGLVTRNPRLVTCTRILSGGW